VSQLARVVDVLDDHATVRDRVVQLLANISAQLALSRHNPRAVGALATLSDQHAHATALAVTNVPQ